MQTRSIEHTGAQRLNEGLFAAAVLRGGQVLVLKGDHTCLYTRLYINLYEYVYICVYESV